MGVVRIAPGHSDTYASDSLSKAAEIHTCLSTRFQTLTYLDSAIFALKGFHQQPGGHSVVIVGWLKCDVSLRSIHGPSSFYSEGMDARMSPMSMPAVSLLSELTSRRRVRPRLAQQALRCGRGACQTHHHIHITPPGSKRNASPHPSELHVVIEISQSRNRGTTRRNVRPPPDPSRLRYKRHSANVRFPVVLVPTRRASPCITE